MPPPNISASSGQPAASLAPPQGCREPFWQTALGIYARAVESGIEHRFQHLLRKPPGLNEAYSKMKALGGRSAQHVAASIHYASKRGVLQPNAKLFAKFFAGGKGELLREKLLGALLEPGARAPDGVAEIVWNASSKLLGKGIKLHGPKDGALAGPGPDAALEELHLCCMRLDGALRYWPLSSGLAPPDPGMDPDGLTEFRALLAVAHGKRADEVRQEEINAFRQQIYRHLCQNHETYQQQFQLAQMGQEEVAR